MSDSSAGRAFNTVAIPAALVFPDDPLPNMGHDTARIPVRVVWRESDAAADRSGGSGSTGAVRPPDANAKPGDDRGGDDPAPDVPAGPGPERPPSPGLSGVDPIAAFLRVNEALDRLAQNGNAGSFAGSQFSNQPAAEPINYFTGDINNSTANALGMSRTQLRAAIHSLKDAAGLRGNDNVQIHIPSGDVFFQGDKIGNLNDE